LVDLYLAEGRPEAAEPPAAQALEIAPRDPAVRISLGNVHDALGDAVAAEGHYQQAIRLDATRPDGYIALAEFHLAHEENDKAVAAYKEAMRIAPLDWTLWVSLASAYTAMERYAEALSAYERAAEMNPSVAEPWLGQGDVRMAQEKWDAAEKAYEQARQLRPQQAEPLLRLALLAEERENPKKATELAQQAIELDPNSAAGYVALGRILQTREKTSKAADAFISAFQRDARQTSAYNRWMWCYTEVKRQPYSLDRSRLKAKLAEIADGDQAETVWAHTLLGLGYLTLEENIDQAVKHLEEAARLDPAFAGLYESLALANEEIRDGPRALAWWQRYLKAAGRGTDTSDAEKHIENIKLVSIEAPADGDQVSGSVKIVGTAYGKYVDSYKLTYRAVGSEEWSSIGTGISPVKHEKLATWNTSGLVPGEYELRLDVVRSDDDFRPWDQITVTVRAPD
jgi:tetratricopeptide (TPR) repeat protein